MIITLTYHDSKKSKDLERSSHITLSRINDNGEVIPLTWSEYKDSLDNELSVRNQVDFISALLSQVDFRDRVDFNVYRHKHKPTFIQCVDYLIDLGARYTKKGIKL